MKKYKPEDIPKIEKFLGILYSILTWIAVIILCSSVVFLLIYFISFIVRKDIFNDKFIQVCIWFTIGCFLFIFVHDEKCKTKITNGNKKNEKRNRKKD